MNGGEDWTKKLREVVEAVEGDFARLAVMGRAPSPDEEAQTERLGRALALLREALGLLEEAGDGPLVC